jgi:hypothetical protein
MEATAIVLKLLGESQRRRSASVRIGKRQKLTMRRRNAGRDARAALVCARGRHSPCARNHADRVRRLASSRRGDRVEMHRGKYLRLCAPQRAPS